MKLCISLTLHAQMQPCTGPTPWAWKWPHTHLNAAMHQPDSVHPDATVSLAQECMPECSCMSWPDPECPDGAATPVQPDLPKCGCIPRPNFVHRATLPSLQDSPWIQKLGSRAAAINAVWRQPSYCTSSS